MSDTKKILNSKVKKIDELLVYFEDENKELDLENDINKYEEAMKLINEVKKELQGIELRINEIKLKYEEE